MRVTAIVCTAGRSPHLTAVLDALRADDVVEIVLVDDRPAGADRPPLPAPDDPRVRIVSTGGVGPGPARQAGVERAMGDVVLLVDDDVVPEPGMARGHAARHAAEQGLVVVGWMPVWAAADATDFPRRLYGRDYDRRVAAYAAGGDVLLHLWTGNVSLRRADALMVGMASPAFAGYRHEDQDLGLRCRGAGLRGVFAPELRAEHRYTRSAEAFFADARAQGREQALLREIHSGVLPPLDAALLRGLPPGARQLASLARRPRAAQGLRAVLHVALRGAGRLGGLRAQLPIAQLLRRVEQIDGALRPDVGQ